MNKVTPRTVDTPKRLERLTEKLDAAEVVSFDIETQTDAGYSNLEEWHPHSRIVCVSFTIPQAPNTGYVVPLTHPKSPWADDWREVYCVLLSAAMAGGGKLVAHNAKFEARWSAAAGIDVIPATWWDTMMSAHLLDENRAKGLEDLCSQELGWTTWKGMVDLSDAEGQPWDKLALYNALDTVGTLALQQRHRALLGEDESIGRIFAYVGMPITRAFTPVERRGIKADRKKIEQGEAESTRIVAEREEQLEGWVPPSLAGVFGEDLPHEHGPDCDTWKCPECGLRWTGREATPDFDDPPWCAMCETEARQFTCRKRIDKRYPISWAPTSKFFGAFMEHMAEVIERTPNGAPSWDASVLKRLERRGYEWAALLLEMRDHSKRLDFLTDWRTRLDHVSDDRIRTNFKPAHVITGRVSSERPNMQQVPKPLRSCFTAEDGYWFVEGDLSQIELRIAAELAWRVAKGRVPCRMMQAYQRDDDLHTLMASRITGKRPSAVLEEERFGAKAANFGFLYGMYEQTFTEQAWRDYGLEFDLDQAKQLREAFFAQWPELAIWHEHQRRTAHEKGYVRSLIGRKRRLPEIHSSAQFRVNEAERKAINSPVQSFASDLTLLAIINITKNLDPNEVRVVGTVHDSILMEIRKETLKHNLRVIGNLMLYPDLKRRFGVELTVPLGVEFVVGRFWGDPESKEVALSGN